MIIFKSVYFHLYFKVSVDGAIWTLTDDINYWLSVGAVPPQNGLLQAISRQISYYLSDEYLEKDKYLLRQVRN